MLARLQILSMGLMTAIALGWAGVWWHLGAPLVALSGVAVVATAFLWVLSLQFVLMALTNRAHHVPREGVAIVLKAWAVEVLTAICVFGWRQPFRSRAVADVPGRPGQRGIVFIHGYVCNRGIWNPWLRWCAREGVPCTAVNLEPVFSSLDAYSPIVDRAVREMQASTGLAPLIVCHSMGGLVARHWLATATAASSRAHHIITIGSPHHGTWLARLSRTINSRQMRLRSHWVSTLAAGEARRHALFTCFYSHCDNIVFPAEVATLRQADNRRVRGVAHVAMAYHPEVRNEVARQLARDTVAAEAAALK